MPRSSGFDARSAFKSGEPPRRKGAKEIWGTEKRGRSEPPQTPLAPWRLGGSPLLEPERRVEQLAEARGRELRCRAREGGDGKVRKLRLRDLRLEPLGSDRACGS